MPPLYKTWVEGRSVSLCQVNSLQVNIFIGYFGAVTPGHPRIGAHILFGRHTEYFGTTMMRVLPGRVSSIGLYPAPKIHRVTSVF